MDNGLSAFKFFNTLITFLKKKFKKRSFNLGLYFPSNYEINVLKILDINEIKKIKILLPSINGDKMFFSQWNIKDVLQVNKYGMLEPHFKKKKNNS